MRDPRYDILFEPVVIGPHTARNRFFQVPHCNGMGYRDPTALAEMRGVKAEGGWAVVSTEEVEIHPSSDTAPFIELRLWDDDDIPALARTADRIHDFGALAAIELAHNGMAAQNLYSREAPLGPAHLPLTDFSYAPVQARRMDRRDIADLRRWHRKAAERSLQAGYDIVYVYGAHNLTTIQHFLSKRYNDRSDEYGGSIENRARLLREILEETVEVVDGRAAVACRLVVDELLGGGGIERDEITAVLEMVGEVPDLWDFVIGAWEDDSVTSRFGPEGGQEEYVRGLKALTSKPVVGVGRFTSPDTMVRMIRQGVLDFIGAARPSIADPFLPRKIEEGRSEDIRECIGCNICVSGDFTMSPIRCTQNPAMGEEWRRGWHPERIKPKESDARILVVGAGPAGLEAAQAAGKRGYEVVLVEATRQLGGRVALEARLPGLAAWIRVLDYRRQQIDGLPNVTYYFESAMTAGEILEYGFDHIAIATGARWRADGIGRWHTRPVAVDPGMPILTPDDLLAGSRPAGRTVAIFDDDHYYLGGVLAELLLREGYAVTLITQAPDISHWTHNTMEQHRIQGRLLKLGAELITQQAVVRGLEGALVTQCRFTGTEAVVPCEAAVFVTGRLPNDDLVTALLELSDKWPEAGLRTVRAVGDAYCPGTIAAAVWDGHRFAEELELSPDAGERLPFRREVTRLAD